ncbi:LolA family protein [Streptomyces lonegramiae]|uniref:Sigma-E factor regulatory protein RseB domain-containing protein n=1 Tax=Streptomyces lonegramiae TaxID=3075524 RepID=A0ABU2XJT0_9ACTN|nr:sigma-E factor regulatory protein RseB domain-containing protein [Streptomyces sp. DSM 41529]MDT0546102.1 sigma-E factor regulatory protein RseB domain-containing protein [Streptomyces sp. DSM 41529]
MARIRPTQVADDGFWDEDRPKGRHKAVRYAVPVAVAGIAAATIGLVPALASTGDPDLPKITAEELISKIAASDAEQLSGSVKITTDLGIPSLPGGGSLADLAGGQHGDGGAAASPDAKLIELASGSHTLRVAADGPERQRVSIIEKAAEYSVIHNGDEVWAYNSADNSVYHAKSPERSAKGDHRRDLPEDLSGLTPQKAAKQALAAVDDTTQVKVDGTARVAGRDAYQLLIRPKQSDAAHSTVGSIRIAVDADNGVPLKFTLEPKSGGKAAIDVAFTQVDFGKPKASTFDFTPPKGAKVTEESRTGHKAEAKAKDKAKEKGLHELSGLNVVGKGWDSVARLDLPGGLPAGASGGGGPSEFLGGLGKKVKGDFGSGTVLSTRLVNALITDDGKVFVGAVDKSALIDAADAAK